MSKLDRSRREQDADDREAERRKSFHGLRGHFLTVRFGRWAARIAEFSPSRKRPRAFPAARHCVIWGGLASTGLANPPPDLDRLPGLGDVVDTEDLHALIEGGERGRQGAR